MCWGAVGCINFPECVHACTCSVFVSAKFLFDMHAFTAYTANILILRLEAGLWASGIRRLLAPSRRVIRRVLSRKSSPTALSCMWHRCVCAFVCAFVCCVCVRESVWERTVSSHARVDRTHKRIYNMHSNYMQTKHTKIQTCEQLEQHLSRSHTPVPSCILCQKE